MRACRALATGCDASRGVAARSTFEPRAVLAAALPAPTPVSARADKACWPRSVRSLTPLPRALPAGPPLSYIRIDGSTKQTDRFDGVNQFQEDAGCRVRARGWGYGPCRPTPCRGYGPLPPNAVQ